MTMGRKSVAPIPSSCIDLPSSERRGAAEARRPCLRPLAPPRGGCRLDRYRVVDELQLIHWYTLRPRIYESQEFG